MCIKVECAFLFSNFLLTFLCNYSASFLLDVISFLTVPPEVFYQNIYKLSKQIHVEQALSSSF